MKYAEWRAERRKKHRMNAKKKNKTENVEAI